MAGTISPEYPTGTDSRGPGEGKIVTALKTATNALNAILTAENKVDFTGAKFKSYEPKIINTEESRGGVSSFAVLTTPDEIQSIVVPSNGKLRISYRAQVKTGTGVFGKFSVFIGTNEVKNTIGAALVPSTFESTEFKIYGTNGAGIGEMGIGSNVTTGQIISTGPLDIFLAAGTYNVSIQYYGTIIAKERKLWAEVYG